jgi:transcriptional regulator with XRE-family HTH domain
MVMREPPPSAEAPVSASSAEAPVFVSSEVAAQRLFEEHPRAPRLIDALFRRKRLLRVLASWREELDENQEDLADKLHCAQPGISRLELGKVDPKLSTLERYAAALDANFLWQIVSDEGIPVDLGFTWSADVAYRRDHPGTSAGPEPKDIRELPMRLFDALLSHESSQVESLYTPHAEFWSPGADMLHGRSKIAEFSLHWLDAFSDPKFQCDVPLADGPITVAQGVFQGTHTGTLPPYNIPATGKHVELYWQERMVVSEGLISAHNWTFDRLELFAQLGVISAGAVEYA